MIYGGLCNCGAWQSRHAPTPRATTPRDCATRAAAPPRRAMRK